MTTATIDRHTWQDMTEGERQPWVSFFASHDLALTDISEIEATSSTIRLRVYHSNPKKHVACGAPGWQGGRNDACYQWREVPA